MTNTGTPALLVEARSAAAAAAARHATGRAGSTGGCRCSLRQPDGAPPAFLTVTETDAGASAGAGACRGVPGATDAVVAAL